MKWQHFNRSEADYQSAPSRVQKAFDKQARILAGAEDRVVLAWAAKEGRGLLTHDVSTITR